MLRPLSASELLDLWERGMGAVPVEQGLLLLQVAYPELSYSYLLALPIGYRDAILMRLREKTFGSSLTGLAVCPNCAERVEISFPLMKLYAADNRYPELLNPSIYFQPQRIEVVGFDVSFRVPNSKDLLRLPDDSASARLKVLQTCLTEIHHDGKPVSVSELPADAIDVLSAQMDQADPLANVHLPLRCPACNHAWEVTFDIVSYFWNEINAWAQRLLTEVHVLAAAYGWHEADILSMSAWRRQRYLELIGV